MFMEVTPLAQQALVLSVLGLLAAVLAGVYWRLKRRAVPGAYHAGLAWLRALLYFCGCLVIATLSQVLAAVLERPLASAQQLGDPVWLAYTVVCFVVILIAYGLIWPLGTFTDGRRHHAVLAMLYGGFWGICQGLMFLSIWALVERSGLGLPWVAVLSYVLIGGYNGCLHHFYWDRQVSPPHNYSEWNGRKVLFCHTPNLLLSLGHLAVYGNVGVFLLLQALALALSARAMRFPAFWDDYTAVPGQERSLARKGPVAA